MFKKTVRLLPFSVAFFKNYTLYIDRKSKISKWSRILSVSKAVHGQIVILFNRLGLQMSESVSKRRDKRQDVHQVRYPMVCLVISKYKYKQCIDYTCMWIRTPIS